MRTMEAILAEEQASREAFESNQLYKGHKVSDLRAVFEGLQSKSDWKAAWAAAVPHQIVGLSLAAVEYFHGSRARVVGIQPLTGKVILAGDGYAC